MLPTTIWKECHADSKTQENLAKELGIHPILSRILLNRNISTTKEAKKFLFPSLRDLHNPFLMKDMKEGVDRAIKAILEGEKVMIYGDYDADGITSTVLLIKFLRYLKVNTSYYIPDRIRDGYGLHKEALDSIKNDGTDLIITVDCGVSDNDEILYASSLGIDTIILDHHEVPDTIPDAIAVIDPHRKDCSFPFKHLAGVGVAFNFLIALRGGLRNIGFWKDRKYPNLRKYLDLVALGTIGDVVPLVDENRIFAKIGMETINEGKSVGLRALRSNAGLEGRTIGSEAASFSIIPRINAAGRVGSPEDAVQLLLTEDTETALRLSERLNAYNRERQEIERIIVEEILHEIKASSRIEDIKSFVFASQRWHPGVIGIVASKIVDRYYRPTILISLKDGIGKGSGRSISEFNLYRSLEEKCASLLVSYGGHRHAAGITIREEDIEDFSQILDDAVRNELDGSDLIRKTDIDAECGMEDINYDLISQIEMLSPFGNMNPEPVLCTKDIRVASLQTVGNNHLKMNMKKGGLSYDSIWFNKGHFADTLAKSTVDIAFTPQINNWRGESSIQLKLKDISKHE
jgi:single-stranded-DNA-specific exonuclease